ncbi:MAG: hypothetical protein JXR83_15510 [Deltaproteobacteria bacterium]|nr:hypothetical protein [Deltaproteobacteria bacterium]
MTTKMLALVFGVAAVVAAGVFPVMDRIAVKSEQAEIEMFAAEPYVVHGAVIEQKELSTVATTQSQQSSASAVQ